MEVKIYKIKNNDLANLKKVLDAEDMCEIKIKCNSCGNEKNEKINANNVVDYEGTEKKPPKVKCSCGGALKVLEKNYIINHFKLNGFTLRDGKSLDLGENHTYLYIKAEPEFFEKNEKMLVDVEKVYGIEFEKVKSKIEEEQDSAAAGLGGIFG